MDDFGVSILGTLQTLLFFHELVKKKTRRTLVFAEKKYAQGNQFRRPPAASAQRKTCISKLAVASNDSEVSP